MGVTRPNIMIIGDIMLDHNIEGIATKIANEGPIPVINVLNERYSIGGCGNVILNSLALGAKNIFILSRVGADDNGIKLQNILPYNCQNYILNDPDYITITKTRVYSDKKLVARYDREITRPISNEQEINIIDNFKKVISENKISSVIFSDYNKGFLTKSLCQTIIKLCR
jgi:D-beta-D-heptose 7-phosphate kinase/D-beta-D-heptose 1-phosphate adenosyltransferase